MTGIESLGLSRKYMWTVPFFGTLNEHYDMFYSSDFSSDNFGKLSFLKCCEIKISRKPDSSFISMNVCIEYDKYPEFLEIYLTLSIIDNENKRFAKHKCGCLPKNRFNRCYYFIDNFIDGNSLIQNPDNLLREPYDSLRIICKLDFVEKPDIFMIGDNMVNENMSEVIDQDNDFSNLLMNQKFCDVKLIARDGEIHAHKAILAARSPVFSRTFENETKERSEIVVDMRDVDYKVLKAMLDIIYGDECEDLKELASEILPVAEKYLVRKLKLKCEVAIIQNMDVYNVVKNMILADKCNSSEIKTAAVNFITSHGLMVTQTNEFKELKRSQPRLLEEILCQLLQKINI